LIRKSAQTLSKSLFIFLKIGRICCDFKHNLLIYQDDDIFISILDNLDYGTNSQIIAYSIFKLFNGFDDLKVKYHSFDSIQTNI
jgi:hypothetical protein